MSGNVFAGTNKDDEPSYIYAAKDRMIEVEDRQRAVRDKRFKYIRNFHPENPGAEPLAFRDNLDVMQELWRYHRADELKGVQKIWFEPRAAEELYDTLQDPHEVDNLAGNPRYVNELIRLRAALDQWLQVTDDQGEIVEIDMAQQFWPEALQPQTQKPIMDYNKKTSQLTLHAATTGASIGYRKNEGTWKVYHQPVSIEPHDSVAIKSVRYGWKESELRVWSAGD